MSYRILNLSGVCAVGGLLLSFNAFADLLVVPAPCANSASTATTATGASGKGGLRFCKDMLYAPAASPTPGLLAMISNNVPNPTQSNQPQRGTLQQYADCYYKGYELDSTGVANLNLATTPNVCALGNATKVHNFCSIVPNHLNNNTSEGSAQNPNNVAGTSCGQFAQINVSIQNNCPQSASVPIPVSGVPSPTASQAAFLAQNNLNVPGLENLSETQLAQLQAQSGVTTASVQQAATNGQQSACIVYTLPKPNPATTPADPSWERTQLSGSYMLALASNSDEVLNELSCQQSLIIDTTGACYAQAQVVMGLISQLQNASTQLGGAANIGDIDYCQAAFPGNTGNGVVPVGASAASLTGTLRQSASFLCSARTKLEAAYGQLAMCDIFSKAQNDYNSKTGPASQPAFFSNMTAALDNQCRTGGAFHCNTSKSIPALQSCINSCYQANVQNYFLTTMKGYWPQPTPVNTSCVAGGQVYVGN